MQLNSTFKILLLIFIFLFKGEISCIAAAGNECISVPVKPQKEERNRKKIKKSVPPHDYGDRTQLSAFILCIMLGFTGAHHFYLKHYIAGILQLSFFLISITLSTFGIALFFSWLFILALWAWVAVDIFLLIFGGLRLKKGKKLIPFEQSI